MLKMRNVNVFVDVDLTLVDHLGVLKPGAVEAMQTLHDDGSRQTFFRSGPSPL